MKRKLICTLLLCALTLLLAPAASAKAPVTEVDSAVAMSEALQPGAQTLRADSAERANVLLLADALRDDHGAVRVIRWADMHQYVLQYADRAAAERAAAALQAEYGADRCWLDTPDQGAAVLAEGDETEKPDRPWNTEALELDHMLDSKALRAHFADRTVKIAVLDTGADMTVSLLKARGISPDSFDFVNATKELTDIPSGSSAGHGTTIATLLSTLLPENAELMILRVFDDSGSASRTTVRTALNYALVNGADLINISLGWEGADSSVTFLNDLLTEANERGVAVICAAGNKGRDARTCYPASYPSTIAVSAVGKDLDYQLFSNYGDAVDFAAPGSDVVAVAPGNSLELCRGTSYAAPHLTAAAADLLLAEKMDADALYETLRSCAEDLGDEGKDRLYGWGLPKIAGYLDAHLTHRWDGGHAEPLATVGTDGAFVRTCTVCGETRTERIPATVGAAQTAFSDVPAEQFYAAPVAWATANRITDGTDETHFSPALPCTRAQIVTFLWRAAGCPEPEAGQSPFADVQSESSWYYRPVLWAVQQGITDGVDETHFAPDQTVTRDQAVTFLWRMHDKPAPEAANPFEDVPPDAYFADAVRWAVEKQITDGTDETHFSPALPCTRAQIVTFLYRDLGGLTP